MSTNRRVQGDPAYGAFAFHKLVQRIREELETFPNLRMNISEAARFWGLDLATCWRVLTELRVIGVVSRDPDCRYYELDGVRS